MDSIDKERLDIPAGVRGRGTMPKAAVRRADLSSLVSLPKAGATQVAAGGTVTAEAYNALLADFTALRQAIDQIATKVKP